MELTQDVVDAHKWHAFWDAPLDLRTEVGGGSPPPPAWRSNQASRAHPTRSVVPTPSMTSRAADSRRTAPGSRSRSRECDSGLSPASSC